MIKKRFTWFESSVGMPTRRLASGLFMLCAAMFASSSQAQSCDAEAQYDTIVSSFHQSVAQRTDGSWAGWGQHMSPTGTDVLTPRDLNFAGGYTALGNPSLPGAATPLLVTTGSHVNSNHQDVMLATNGLYAWGIQNTVLPTAASMGAGYTTNNNFQRLTFGPNGNGMPPGVAPSDVAQVFATWKTFVIVTHSGHAWVLATLNGNTGATLTGDNTPIDSLWHQVLTGPGTPLTNVISVRGQVSDVLSGALMALTSDGRAYVWGRNVLLGDNSATQDLGYATEMLLPHQLGFAAIDAALHATVQNSTPTMIGVTGGVYGNANRRNSYFVLYANGRLFSMGSNDLRQLGDFTMMDTTSWVAVLKPTGNEPNTPDAAFDNVRFISVQEHDRAAQTAGGPAAALITTGGVLYTWGSNNGRMIGRVVANTLGCDGSRRCNPGIPEAFIPGTHIAKTVEVGGHTTVYLRDRSTKFCYVGHRTNGSMGVDLPAQADFGPFNCDDTPVLNICGSTGYDYGDAPAVFEAGGGSNLAMHFYIEQELPNPPNQVDPITNRLYLGDNWPRINDDTPHSVVIQTDNTSPFGDCGDWAPAGCEEDASTDPTQLELSDAATSHQVTIKVNNRALNADKEAVAARLYAWVDWDNDNKFSTSEIVTSGSSDLSGALTITDGALMIPACAGQVLPNECPANSGEHEVTLTWNGLAGLEPGWRYMRLRLTTAPNLADLVGTADIDERALKFAGDGEMEDLRLLITDSTAPENVPPIGIDVHADQVVPGASPAQLLVSGSPAALQGWDSDGSVVSYRIQTVPGCQPATCQLYTMIGTTLVPLSAGQPISLAQAQNLYFSTTEQTGTSFTFRAIDDDGDESVDRACDSLVNDCQNTLPGTIATPPRDAIFTIPVSQPVLTLGKTVSVAPNNFQIGTPASYTLTVTNTNAPTYAAAIITDVIPSGLTIGTLPAGCVRNPPASQTVVCTIPAPLGYGLVPNDNVASFVIPVTPAAGIANPVTNTASVTGGGSGSNCSVDPSVAACNAEVVTGVDGADMTPVFGGIPAVLEPGEVVTGSTLTCTNNGPGAAAAATCVPSVDVGSINNVVCVPPTPVASLPAAPAVGSSIVCTFTYTTPGTPGGSNTVPTGVTFTGTTGATNDTNGGTGTGGNNSTTVTAPIIDAVDDSTSAPGGSTGNTFDLTPNDDYPPGSTFSYTGGTCANGSVSSSGTATFDAIPNPCTVTYQVCAPTPNEAQCDTATLTVTSALSDMSPTFGGLPGTLAPGGVVTGATLTCVNAGPASATNATCVPSVDAGTISNVVCVPTTPVASLPVAPAAGSSIVCTFDYTAPGTPGGGDTVPTGVTFTGTTGATNDSNPTNNTTTQSAPLIDALDDDFTGTPIPGASGGTTPSVIGNDTVGTVPAVIGSNVSLTPGIPSNTGLVMDPTTGIITVPPLLPPGTYTYPYTVCVLPATVPPTCDTATAELIVSEAPSLSIVKSVTSAGPYTAGSTIAYSFLVTNTGNTVLNSVSVVDPQLDAPAVCVATTLAPTASTTCTGSYVVQPADVEAGNVNNTAIAQGTPPATPTNPNPTPVPSQPDEEDTPITQNPALSIVKSVTSTGPYTAGSTIAYSFLVTNIGDVTLNTVSVVDPQLDAPAVCVATTLAPTASTTCTGSYVVQPADVEAGNVNNVAIAQGTPPVTPTNPTPTPVTSPPDEEDTPIDQDPSLSIVKSVTSTGPYTAGSTIAYSFLVTNTGDVTLSNVSVNDPLLDAPAVCVATTLAPTASTTCTGSYVVQPGDVKAGNVNNVATAQGTPPVTPTNPTPTPVTSPPDEEDTPIAQDPALSIVKSVTSTGPYTAGSTIAYSFLVTNLGDVTLSNVSVNDPLLDAPAVCAATTLAPTASTTCTGTYVVQPADVEAGNVNNVATAQGTPPVTPTNPAPTPVTSPPDEEDTPIAQNPSLSIVKSVTSTGPYSEGDTITYQFLVTNTGDVTLSNVSVDDPLPNLSVISYGAWPNPALPGVLPPGQSVTATATYVVTQVDVRAGSVRNVAIAEGTPPVTPTNPTPTPVPSPPDEEVTPTPTPVLAILKTGPAVAVLGQQVVFTVLVTNEGPTTAHNVVVTDPTPTGLSFVSNSGDCTTAFPCNLGTLLAGESRVIDVRLLVPDSYGGPSQIINIATVRSTSTDDETSSSATVPTQLPKPAMIPVGSPWALLMLGLLMTLVAAGQVRMRLR